MSDPFRILVVCTGNICRSAQAEQLIRARIAERFPLLKPAVVVESAGTRAMVGSDMPTEAAAGSVRYGGSPAGHSGCQLTMGHVRRADLVLGMATEHRSAVVRLLPRSSRIAFTLTEFAALLESAGKILAVPPAGFSTLDAADKLRSGVKWAAARRGYLAVEEGSPVDVVDPYRRSQKTYEESARQIVEALNDIESTAMHLAERLRA
ncbi:arsenate reductase/protein-tyrosine-phosphatase family protein [Nesterenkonia sandarakina]|uniref:Protein-tyrosine phosphatase n=1 Tax=Nesterenkonia sandarakina TaxID=272918 RepID=A0A2T0YEZ2_9MICC|nr:low molecular weight phosphatase family protein [Nesterenkonia sandarakina]PRZ13401.1 protein-tyrosine phosphatase [Nesterenkonia sandarakina]